jgi:hypothetical protein
LSAPRQGHLKAATRIFEHLNRTREKWIFIDPEDLVHPGEFTRKYEKGKMIDTYPGAAEELDPKFPAGLMKELDTPLYCDSNFAHGKEKKVSLGHTRYGWKYSYYDLVRDRTRSLLVHTRRRCVLPK